MSIYQFSRLPKELLQEILLQINYNNIQKLCSISNDFMSICRLNKFWRAKFIHDYGFNPPIIGLTSTLEKIYLYQNNILSFGSNYFGQLGLGDNYSRSKPTHINYIKAKFVSCGNNYTVLIDINNNVWAFGFNYHGELGLGDNTNSRYISKPTKINDIKAKSISCGHSHTLLIDMNNNVWSFGSNSNGQLGLGNSGYDTNKNEPTKINGIKAKFVSCGSSHTLVIDMNNNVWAFGSNEYGQLGLGNNGYNTNITVPTKINGIKAKYISCGNIHTVLIDMNNDVWAFGNNIFGKLGLGDNTNRNVPTKINGINAKYVSCGHSHTVLIDMNNNVWSFGDNYNGQLGLGYYTKRNVPTKINGIKAKYVSCGNTYTMLIDMNNDVWVFGSNNDGQLELGDNRYKNVPIKINGIKAKSISGGRGHTVLITGISN